MFQDVSAASVASPIRLRRFFWTLAAFWTTAIAVVLLWELSDEHAQTLKIARGEAAGAWKRESAVYHWVANTGGVYVPVAEDTKPDDSLDSLADRDATTASGRKLTLIGTPTILNRLHAIAFGQSGVRGHLTSLQPVRPENAPDPWERQSLEAFAQGVPEEYSVGLIDGKRYMRLMRPLRTEASCMKCHAEQGFKEGEIRGALSIAVPMDLVQSTEVTGMIHRVAGYGGMWLLGLFGISLMSRHLQQQVTRRHEAELKLQESHDLLEQRVADRTVELAEANNSLNVEIADRRQAELWLLESEQRFRGYFEQGLVGMAILTPEGDWIEVNERLCRMLGYTEEELVTTDWLNLTHPDNRAAGAFQFQQVLDGVVRSFSKTTRLMRKDRTAVAVGLSAQCLRKSDGAIDCILVLVQDMTHLHATTP